MRPSSPFVVLFAALVACVPDGTPAPKAAPNAVAPVVTATPVARAEAARVDSATDADADAEVDSLMAAAHRTPGSGAPYPGTWSPTQRVTDELFTLDIPPQASGAWDRRRPSETNYAVTKLPGCIWYCAVTVRLSRPASLDSIVHAETHPDTTGRNGEAADYAATLLDTLPVNGARAAHLQRFCGDCSTYVIIVASEKGIAEVEYSLDNRERTQEQLSARLETVARTFRWR